MEKIELRSEKVRNFIGIIPPFLIRLGNIFIFFLLIMILITGYVVKLPNTVSCDVQVCEREGNVQLAVTSVSKLIITPIRKQEIVVEPIKEENDAESEDVQGTADNAGAPASEKPKKRKRTTEGDVQALPV
jgi:hypothetical protein